MSEVNPAQLRFGGEPQEASAAAVSDDQLPIPALEATTTPLADIGPVGLGRARADGEAIVPLLATPTAVEDPFKTEGRKRFADQRGRLLNGIVEQAQVIADTGGKTASAAARIAMGAIHRRSLEAGIASHVAASRTRRPAK